MELCTPQWPWEREVLPLSSAWGSSWPYPHETSCMCGKSLLSPSLLAGCPLLALSPHSGQSCVTCLGTMIWACVLAAVLSILCIVSVLRIQLP